MLSGGGGEDGGWKTKRISSVVVGLQEYGWRIPSQNGKYLTERDYTLQRLYTMRLAGIVFTRKVSFKKIVLTIVFTENTVAFPVVVVNVRIVCSCSLSGSGSID